MSFRSPTAKSENPQLQCAGSHHDHHAKCAKHIPSIEGRRSRARPRKYDAEQIYKEFGKNARKWPVSEQCSDAGMLNNDILIYCQVHGS